MDKFTPISRQNPGAGTTLRHLFAMILLSLVFCVSFAGDGRAETKTGANSQIMSEIKQDQTVSISVDLEDASRFMGINVYRIGYFDGEKFCYTDELRPLVDRDYSYITSDENKYKDCEVFLEYFETLGDSAAEAKIPVVKGVGSVDGLPVGLYIIQQSGADCNASLREYTFLEAPTLSNSEYLYDIHLYPRWDREVWFSFRPDVVSPLFVIVTLFLCVLTAFWGAKLFRGLFYGACFAFFGYLGYLVGCEFVPDFLWLMVVTMIAAFVGIGLLWGVFTVVQGAFFSRKIKKIFSGHLFWITPILACLVAIYVIRKELSENLVISIVIPVTVSLMGLITQFIKRNEEKVFYTYEDLISMKRVDEEATENA